MLSLGIFPQAKCEPTDHNRLCDTEIGSRHNYGFTSIPETLDGDGGGNGGGGGAPWSPA